MNNKKSILSELHHFLLGKNELPDFKEKKVPSPETQPSPTGKHPRPTPDNDPQPGGRNTPNKKEEAENKVHFSPRDPICSFDAILLAPEVQKRIDSLLTRIRFHKKLYDDWNLQKIDPQGKHVAVNFYGASGTGKTMCAEALASALNKQIIEVSYAEMESKYVGETSKNIEAAFRAAAEHDAVLFFDEADSLLGKRLSNVTQSSDHAVNTSRSVMLKQLDRFEGIVVFATNLAESFDRAFVRRILEHIELPLPTAEVRLRLWQHFVVPEITGRNDLNWEELVEKSDKFSGALILDSVKLACGHAVRTTSSDDTPVLKQEHLLDALEQIRQSRAVIATHGTSSL